MSHYDLNRMGWQQFEHMVQALAKAEMGNGVTAFGSGRDGQREATFRGRVTFPVGSAEGPWNGYGVVQAKYLERPKDTNSDWNWFLREIQNELRAWAAKKKLGKRTPIYFLGATNAVLSGTEDSGGKDRFDQLLESFRDELGLKGWYAWDDTELRTLLDRHTEIRQRYLELIVLGDFLVAIEALAPKLAITARKLSVNAASDLTNRQWVRTGDSGFRDSSKLRLADIGIDLPCLGEKTKNHPNGPRFAGAQWAIDAGDFPLRQPSGVVLVGGPGQGKSTLVQLISHAYRIGFIDGTDPIPFGENANIALNSLKARLRQIGIRLPKRRRWPIQVDLAKMATSAAAAGDEFSLLAYLAEVLIVEGKPSDASELLAWMRSWPVCLVLDGLDEVADPRIRIRVTAAITAFVTEAAANEVDLFVVATTRPQGYRGEFADAFPAATIRLAELTETEALTYSDALIAVRNAEDPELAAQVTERLLSAVHDRVTQRLMTTPLQMTIMTALAERAVDLPTNRYDLFDDYYKVIYDREVVKDDAFADMRKLRSHIDNLHEQAALRLHMLAEKGEGSSATLSFIEATKLLEKRLKGAGFEEWRAQEIASELIRLSAERLVMLVSRTKNRYEFEVRSLQEYMAARAITEGSDQEVLDRLRVLIPSSHWRNIWLLAAGRVLTTREHLAVEFFNMVANYDVDGETVITHIGATLAAELLLDEIGAEFPLIQRHLLSAALGLARQQIDETPDDLAQVVAIAISAGDPLRSDALSQLDEISHESLSNVASRFLSENRAGMTPLAKQATVTMGAGRNYIRPAVSRSDLPTNASFSTLAAAVSGLGLPGLSSLTDALTPSKSANERQRDERLLVALRDQSCRQALVSALQSIRSTSPKAADLGLQLLRRTASQAPRSSELDSIGRQLGQTLAGGSDSVGQARKSGD